MAIPIAPGGAVVLIALGATWTTLALRAAWRAGRARGWPRADGVIEFYSVVPVDTADFSYEVRVSYVYTVAGRQYGGDRVRFGDNPHFATAKLAEAWAARMYPAGTVVKVFVDPTDPSNCVLEAEVRLSALLFAVAGLVIVTEGAHALVTGSAAP